MKRQAALITIIFAVLAWRTLTVAQDVTSSPPPVLYSISLSQSAQHLLHIRITVPPGKAEQELQLPVWNALYQVRDFAQYVNWVHATDHAGDPLPVRELDTSRWQISGAQTGATVDYEIFADKAGPFNSQLNSHHTFLNLAQVLMYPVDDRSRAVSVEFRDLPGQWRAATALHAVSPTNYGADNYDQLVDSPVEMGTFQESDFDESGGHYRVIVDADPADYDLPKIVAELRRIVAAATTWMNDRPFDTYTFIYHFPRGPAGGGMEHAYSTAIDINADAIKNNAEDLAGITAHEFFHLWNVKRIRPQTLEPVDYTKENFTRALWFSEGCTSTAGDIIELRAGLIDEKQYLAHLADEITELERRPAHLTQSAEESSLDAWLEGNAYYRRPERSISYYNKGELLGAMLDLELREASHGRASLRELFQWMNVNFARQGKFFDDSNGVLQATQAVNHGDLSEFFAKYVAGTEEIPWNDFLRSVGLRVEQETTTVADPGFSASRNFDGPLSIVSVASGSEAERAGLQVDDTIVAVEGKPSGQAQQELSQLGPGEMLVLKIRARRGVERELKWKVDSRTQVSYEIVNLENVTAEQRARRAAWLKGEAEPSEPGNTGSKNQ